MIEDYKKITCKLYPITKDADTVRAYIASEGWGNFIPKALAELMIEDFIEKNKEKVLQIATQKESAL